MISNEFQKLVIIEGFNLDTMIQIERLDTNFLPIKNKSVKGKSTRRAILSAIKEAVLLKAELITLISKGYICD